jgi:hypothetical protein
MKITAGGDVIITRRVPAGYEGYAELARERILQERREEQGRWK